MKTYVTLALIAPLSGCVVPAQVINDRPPPPPAVSVVTPTSSAVVAAPAYFAPEQLDALLGPIALYPDPLIALILPASTNGSDVVLAARYLAGGNDPAMVDVQPWDDSVRGLAHYPQVIQWMDENLAWTKQLGEAFAGQPNDVMNAVQRLRARAAAAGTLINTPQQQVVYQGSTIVIEPTLPDVIYVPYYDPSIVYSPLPSYYAGNPGLFFSYSSGFAAGWWLSYGLDWPGRRVWIVNRSDRERFWREHHHDWNRPQGWTHNGTSAPPIHSWKPRVEPAPARPATSVRPPVVMLPRVPRPDDGHDDHRNGNRDDHRWQGRPPSSPSRPHDFVGPTAPAAATSNATAVNPPTPAPTVQATPVTPPPQNRSYGRGGDRDSDRDSNRNANGNSRGNRSRQTAPATVATPVPANSSPPPSFVGPVAPAPVQQTRGYTPPPPVTGMPPPARASEPRPAPALQYHAPPPPIYGRAPMQPATVQAPPPVAQPQPVPQAQPPPQQQQQQSSGNQSQDDDGRRRNPFVKPR